MRDYSNIPALNWEGPLSAKKAMAQVHHAEPVILQMPEGFAIRFNSAACGCATGDNPQHFVDCRAADTLKALAAANQMPALAELADIAHEAGQAVDIEANSRRIIIHD